VIYSATVVQLAMSKRSGWCFVSRTYREWLEITAHCSTQVLQQHFCDRVYLDLPEQASDIFPGHYAEVFRQNGSVSKRQQWDQGSPIMGSLVACSSWPTTLMGNHQARCNLVLGDSRWQLNFCSQLHQTSFYKLLLYAWSWPLHHIGRYTSQIKCWSFLSSLAASHRSERLHYKPVLVLGEWLSLCNVSQQSTGENSVHGRRWYIYTIGCTMEVQWCWM